MPKFCIGIDLGGTFIKFGLLDSDRQPVPTFQLPTPRDWGADAVIGQMVAGAKKLMADNSVTMSDVVGVGIGSPGPLNIVEGIVIDMPNIPGMKNIPIRDMVSRGLGLPAVLENDANCAAMGEYLCGAGRGEGDMIMLTLGTGVGSGIIQNGAILHGVSGAGGEIGHMIVRAGGNRCKCGQRGCLEVYGSATYLAARAQVLIQKSGRESSLEKVLAEKKKINSRDVNQARKEGDELATEVWDWCAYYLAVGCVNICRIFDPDRIVIGGGLASAGTDLLNPILDYFQDLNWNLTELSTEILIGYLAGDAGVIGAAGVAWTAFGDTTSHEPTSFDSTFGGNAAPNEDTGQW